MSASYILSIDNGTQSVRAILFDLHGNIVAKTQVHLEAYFSDHPGWAEHDPEDYWQAVCTACQRLWAQNAIAPASIKGVAVTTQRGTMINLDKDGKPLRPAITWLDQRRTDDRATDQHAVETRRSSWPAWRKAHQLFSRRGRDQLDQGAPARDLGQDR